MNFKKREILYILIVIMLAYNTAYADTNPFKISNSYIEDDYNTFIVFLAKKKKAIQVKNKANKLNLAKKIFEKDEEYKSIRDNRIRFEKEEEKKLLLENEYNSIRSKRINIEKKIQNNIALNNEYDLIRKERIDLEKKLNIIEEPKGKKVLALIDISEQTMKVYKGGKEYYTCNVSTGKQGYHTPRGSFKPTHIEEMHYSKKYRNSPMPYSVFFKKGYAIHGTKSVGMLGVKVSHGCIRLNTKDAEKFYNLVKKSGRRYIKIKIID